ncbi:Protein T02D1.8 [Aphelenchoides avenae]|nr:Protein T02D1.8 [Aphelenchus avenae]
MALPDVAAYLADFQKRFDELIESGDTKKAVESFYHPEAVMVKRGQKCWYGTKEITEAFEEFNKMLGDAKFEIHHETVGQTADGEVLYLRGTYWSTGDPSQKKTFGQIFRRVADGQYQIYHDEFVA